MESRLLELKARVESLDAVRKKLRGLKVRFIGTFHQIDTFFNVPKGRLKLRMVEGKAKAELIYYEREDILGPKRSNVLILRIEEPESVRMFFERVVEKTVVTDKKRGIYAYKGTKIHLDTVKNLGTFIEFERKSKNFTKDRKILEDLMMELEIKDKDQFKGSYSDIELQNREQ